MGKAISEASWTGKAAYEIMQMTNLSGKKANQLARDLAYDLERNGFDLADINPLEHACRSLNWGMDLEGVHPRDHALHLLQQRPAARIAA